MTDESRALMKVNAATLLLALAGPLGKAIHLTPLVISFGRTAFAGCLLYVVGSRMRGHSRIQTRRDFLIFLGLACLVALQSMLFFTSVQVSTVAIALVTLFTYPVVMVFAESWVYGLRLRAQDLVSAALVLVGVVCLAPGLDPGSAAFQGVLCGLGAGLTIPIIILTHKKCLVDRYTSWDILAYEMTMASLILLPFVLTTARPEDMPALVDLGLLAVLGFVTTGFARTLILDSLRLLSGKVVGLTIVMEVVYGAGLAAVFLSEIPGVNEFLGGAVIVGVVVLESVRAERAGRTVAAQKVAGD